MSGSFCLNSPPTSDNNGKNSSGTSTTTCTGGVHLCPFQLTPPINQYTYCILKCICRQILKEILTEETKQNANPSVKDELKIRKNVNVINDKKQDFSPVQSPKIMKNHFKLSSNSMKIISKCNKITQTKEEFLIGGESYINNMKKRNFIKQENRDFIKKNITIRPQTHKSGLPLILNLRLQVRNGDMPENTS